MTAIDWVALLIVVFAAIGGLSQGFVWSGLSLVGLAVGAVIGGRLAPVVLSGGSKSPYAPVLALAGAVTLAVTFEVVGSSLGAALRSRESPPVRKVDSAAGVVVGALGGWRSSGSSARWRSSCPARRTCAAPCNAPRCCSA